MDGNFPNLNGLNLPSDFWKNIQVPQPVYHDYVGNQMNETIRAVNETHEEREAEQLRRHEELVGAINKLNNTIKETVVEALKMGASVNIDSNTGIVNLTMNSQNVQQQATQTNKALDYEVAEATLEEISEFLELPKFQKDFGEKANEIKELIEELREDVKQRSDQGVVKRGFEKLKELTTGVEGSLIATAIWEGIKKIPGLFI